MFSPSQLGLFPQPFHFLSYVLMYLIITAWRHWLKTFSISSILILQSVCLHPAYPMFTLSVLYVCLSFHHDDYVVTLFCLYLSTYSATSSSLLRNFLNLKFLSEVFLKIAYSPPSSWCNALSIGIRARYSLVLCDFGLTAWSFSYVDCRNEECVLPHLWRSWASPVEGHDEDKQTEEIELRKLRKSSVKVFKHRYEQTYSTFMRKWKSWGNRTSKLGEDNDLVDQFQLLSQLYIWLERLSIWTRGHTVLTVFSLS